MKNSLIMMMKKFEIIVIEQEKLEAQLIRVVTNLQLTKNVPVIFHNLREYNSHLIFCELNKFDLKIDVIPNRLEKYMAFFLSKT